MISLADSIVRVHRRRVVLPGPPVQCDVCHYWDTSNPEVQELMREAGRPLFEADCRCEERRREEGRAERRRWADSNISHRRDDDVARTFDSFVKRLGLEDAYAAAQEMAAGQGPTVLTLCGDYATGKSHLVEAIGRAWLHDGGTCRYDFVPDLANSLLGIVSARRGFDGGANATTVAAEMDWRASMGLLLLDDLGQWGSEWVNAQITALVDERLRTGGRLVVTINLERGQVADQMDFRLASRLFDRGARVVYMKCKAFGEG
jgi:DNA replication protein DnaC